MGAEYDTINILLYGKVIGAITLLPGERNVFSFTEAYIEDKNRPTLSLSFKSAAGGLIDKPQISRQKLPTFFSNLLPEGALREYLAKKAKVNVEREFFLLAALGKDLPGAVEVQLEEGKNYNRNAEEENILGGAKEDHVLNFSLAGVQLKFSALMHKDGKLTIPAHGVGGSWIVKLPSPNYSLVPENEFAMMTLARQVGIDVPEVKLVPVSEIHNVPDEIYQQKNNALVIKRFDRTANNDRIHMEDFAQIFAVYPREKYDKYNYSNLAFVIWSEIGEQGLDQFVKRIVFNVLIGNGDMHLKNWSLIYPDRKHAALSPAYDFVSTVVYLKNERFALNIGGTKEMQMVSQDLLKRFAAKARVPETLVLKSAKEITENTKSTWTSFKSSIDLPKPMITRIDKHMRSIPIFN
jgi:serine/threonine-protein kinase HipA